MRIDDLVKLQVRPKRIDDPFDYLERLAHRQSVLNVGAAGGIESYLPNKRDIWLHHRLQNAAGNLIGIDIDAERIEFARTHGVDIEHANCETMELGRTFNVIVLSDVIEHMNAPVTAITNLMRHLSSGGSLCVTTPNAMSLLPILRVLGGGAPNVFWDHVSCYLPEHMQSICDRFGFQLREVLFFDHIDRRSWLMQAKSHFSRTTSRLYPRFASSFMAIIGHA